MTSTTQEHSARQWEDVAAPPDIDGHRVVISGMAGLYPQSRYVKDLERILYNKLNPVSTDDLRWTYHHPEVAQYTGNVPDLDRFDAQFFKVHFRLGNNMDSMSRKMLEQSYEAIYDAGINPGALYGKKVAVYVGTCFSETEKACFYVSNTRNGFGIAGCSKTMFANRVSYWLNAKGPSMSIDEACCSSTAALEQAYQAISRGECEAAIVGGANLCLHPQSSVHYGRMMTISMDGKTRSFAEDAAGCAKSEAVNVLFLQKAKDALRVYAEVAFVKSEFVSILDGKVGPKYGFYRDPKDTANFLKNFYDEIVVSPSVVEYVEAFGSAVPEADKSELEAIDKVFCEGRKEPLLIGSVMSNIGYGEAASGISAITKVLLGYHRGELAGNLYCESPRRDVEALREGRIRVLQNNQRFQRNYTAVNSMSVTGVNAHVLLHGNYKPKDINRYKTNIPRIVTISGRQKSSVNKVFNNLKFHPIDPEELALLHNIHEARIPGHLGRGFIILDTNELQKTVSLSERAEHFDDAQRPLWFVYSGMGSQWAGMGTQLMRIPIFAAAIDRCHRALHPKGLDLIHIITSPEPTIFDNILHSFVGIAAVQIGLTDVLRELGLVPDKIIGHSVGELGCAYADDCLTAEEMILSAYSRGLVSLETPLIHGSMAAVGMGFQQMLKICPPGIQIACHNSATSCTISGPAKEMRSFIANLTMRGIFAKEVPCSNIAYHSQYIADAGPALLKYLKEVIKIPKARSERWISTSVPQDRWNEPAAKNSSAEYHTNNLLNPVLFEEASSLIPNNAVLVEVAPHGLLQAILKRALPDSVTNIPLTHRGHHDNILLFLEAVGKLYTNGYNPKVRVLYPKVEFPVSTGTPFLSHLVEWAHQEKWALPLYQTAHRTYTATCSFVISVHDDEYKEFKGHTIRNNTLVPFSFALVAVWDTLAMSLGAARRALAVQFRDVQLHAQPPLHDQRTVRLYVSLQRGSGGFEVMTEYSKVATGFITTYVSGSSEIKEVSEKSECKEVHELNTSDVYRLLYEREYAYSGAFRSIYSANKTLTDANIMWNGNWVTFIDGLIQLNSLKHTYRGISQPEQIRRLVINVDEHLNIINTNADISTTLMRAEVSHVQDRTRCGGILIENMQFRYLPLVNDDLITLQALKLESELDGVCGGQYYLPTQRRTPDTGNKIKLQSDQIGNIDSLRWVQASETLGHENLVTVQVHYAGINVEDVKQALGVSVLINKKYENYNGYAMEFSGLTECGERVMGLVPNGAAGSHVVANPDLMWPVPSHWTLEDAATVPFAYVCAYYCLAIKASARAAGCCISEKNVLVHGATGALGQALISVALANGYRVFATVGEQSKKRFLLKLFPELNDKDIGNSRDESFGDLILNATNGMGCNLVICCLKGNLKNISLKCCGLSGYMIDIAQIPNREKYMLGMYNLSRDRSYTTVDMTSIIADSNNEELKKINLMISEGIARGHVRPLTRVTFPPRDAPRAFRLLAASRHRGRVLLRLQDSLPHVQPKFSCATNGCYIVFCDEQPLGLQLAEKLVDCGVKKLHLYFQTLPPYLDYKLSVWKKSDVEVTLSCGELGDLSLLLQKATKMGPVESVYVAIGNIKQTILANIYLASRQFSPSLKHFLVITDDNTSKCRNSVLSLNEKQIPGTILDLSMLERCRDEDGFTWYHGAVEAVEQAVQSTEQILVAQSKRYSRPALVKQIAALADLDIHDDIPGNTSLKELGMTLDTSETVCAFLKNSLNLSLDEHNIPSLTVNRLKQIEVSTKELEFKEVNGLESFYTYVDPDELLATTEMVFLPTLANNFTMRDDEFDVNEMCLCIVPGLEGHHERFRTLCERLKLPAFVLQPGLDHLDETPNELALRYSKVLLKKTGAKKTFHILGYETGVIVSLELAAILEKHGQLGTLFCIGDGPEETKAMLDVELSEFDTEEALQEAVVRHIFELMASGSKALVESALRGCASWHAGIDVCVRTILGQVSHSAQYAHALVEAAYSRIVMVRQYESTIQRKLRSRIVLMRSRRNSDTGNECSLQRYSQQKLIVRDLAMTMAHAAADLCVSAIINEHLDEEILQAYERKNLCDSYLTNADAFIA